MTVINGYLFATDADPATFGELRAIPGVRVVCPLEGDRRLYVAVAGEDEAAVLATHSRAATTSGLGGVEPYVALPPPLGSGTRDYPTYCVVNAWVGFGLFPDSVTATTLPALDVAGLARVTATTDGQPRLLVEVTAASRPEAQRLLAEAAALLAATPLFTAFGETQLGAGFTTS